MRVERCLSVRGAEGEPRTRVRETRPYDPIRARDLTTFPARGQRRRPRGGGASACAEDPDPMTWTAPAPAPRTPASGRGRRAFAAGRLLEPARAQLVVVLAVEVAELVEQRHAHLALELRPVVGEPDQVLPVEHDRATARAVRGGAGLVLGGAAEQAEDRRGEGRLDREQVVRLREVLDLHRDAGQRALLVVGQ